MLEKQMSFKHNVTIVEIESSSYCNRKCTYCLNRYVNKDSFNHILSEELFKEIINQLSEIDYDRTLTFHRFNEPFEHKNEMILNRITYARSKLPNARLTASTNGDFLDEDYINKLSTTGLDELYVQLHYNDFPSSETVKNDIAMVNSKIGGYNGRFIKRDGAIIYFTINSPFKVLTISSKNYFEDGYDRGGVLELDCKQIYTGSCYGPATSVTIDYNGKVNACCNLVSYVDSHKPYVLGDVSKNSIYDIYESTQSKNIRKKLINGNRLEVCNFCSCNYLNFLQKYNVAPASLII